MLSLIFFMIAAPRYKPLILPTSVHNVPHITAFLIDVIFAPASVATAFETSLAPFEKLNNEMRMTATIIYMSIEL